MSRSKRKPTVKELESTIETLEMKVQQNQQIINALIGELNGVAGLIVTHLAEEGKMERVECPSCGHINNVPRLNDFPADESCIACGGPLFGEEE
tara:strand:+ start:3161 stop:3442 length:282 start_codon:yes stop_codon:yes gene_type:complete